MSLIAILAGCSSKGDDATEKQTPLTGPTTDPQVAPDNIGDPPTDPTPEELAGPDDPIERRPVSAARTTRIPTCTKYVDASAAGPGTGTVDDPFKAIAPAVMATPAGGTICVAEGTYAENLAPGTKSFTLAGGFKRGEKYKIRDSSIYVSKAQGDGSGSFISVTDDAPIEGQLTAIDGFELTGFSQAIVRQSVNKSRFDITNNYIHDNVCRAPAFAGAAFAINNVSGKIKGNVIKKNSCSRGGGGVIDDSTDSNTILVANNVIDGNSGTEPQISHGGGLYFFAHTLQIIGNEFKGNSATGYGGGLFVGANTSGGQHTTSFQSWNWYHDNKAGIAGGGFFCDDAATCNSDHEVYSANCGGNMYFDSGPLGSEATIGNVDHLTCINALEVGCVGGGPGVTLTKDNFAEDRYTFTNSIFFGNGTTTATTEQGVKVNMSRDFDVSCEQGCNKVLLKVGYSLVNTAYTKDIFTPQNPFGVTFGPGNLTPVDPQFVDAAKGDFHLKSTHGHWTSTAYVNDTVNSFALAAGDPGSPVDQNPPQAGTRTELGAYGNSVEASYVQ